MPAWCFKKTVKRSKGKRPGRWGAMRDIANALDIPLIRRIEAFDISNISGYENVGSMIVYEDGKPKKKCIQKV